jgi:hypothetical protein
MNHKRTAILFVVALLLVSIVGSYAFNISEKLSSVFAASTSAKPVPVNAESLHATKEDASDLSWVYPGGFLSFFMNETKGYREITMKFYVWEGKDAEFLVLFGIEGPKGSTSFVVDQFTVLRTNYEGVVKTYAVQGSTIEVRARSLDAVDNSRVILWFYMTT